MYILHVSVKGGNENWEKKLGRNMKKQKITVW